MTDLQAKLLPCPFCGAKTGYVAPPALGKGRWVIQCDDCRAEGPTSSDNSDAGEAEAITAWNTRAPVAAPTGDAVEALEKSLEIIGQYKSDLLRPPTGDSLERRLKWASAGLDAVHHAIATLTGKETT